MNMKRCIWAEDNDTYEKYHDEEWGVPVHDDSLHFEFLVLEGAQAGLSWLTILKRREGYRQAYSGFDPKIVAKFGDRDIERLVIDKQIIRNRQKILSSIRNAKVFLEIQKEFGSFDKYIWGFVKGKPVKHSIKSDKDYQATSELSDTISADLKKRGMSFVGSTIIYAHLQATGIINDHMINCFRRTHVS